MDDDDDEKAAVRARSDPFSRASTASTANVDDELLVSLLEWIGTFRSVDPKPLPTQSAFTGLADGVALSQALHEVDPGHFQKPPLTIPTLLWSLSSFFQDQGEAVDASEVVARVDVAAIKGEGGGGGGGGGGEWGGDEAALAPLLALVQLVLGCAVLCERREDFVGAITALPIEHQRLIKGFLGEFMETVRVEEEDEDEEDEDESEEEEGGDRDRDRDRDRRGEEGDDEDRLVIRGGRDSLGLGPSPSPPKASRGVLRRLEALSRENEALRRANAALEGELGEGGL